MWNSIDEKCISNAFLKGGFPKSNNESEAQNGDIDTEDCFGDNEFNLINMNVDEYIDCDNNVITTRYSDYFRYDFIRRKR